MHRLLALTFLLAPLSAPAQDITHQAEIAASAGRHATQCALLAAGSGGQYAGQAARLASYGHTLTLAAFSEFTATLDGLAGSSTLGPLTPFLRARSADFWTGTYFAHDTAAVNQMIAARHPFNAADTYEQTLELRRLEAELEFVRRQCS